MADITTDGEMPDLDALAAASRERAKQTYPFKYLGKVWHARNAVPFGRLAASLSDDMNLDSAVGVIAEYVVADEREAFKEAVMTSEDVYVSDLKVLSELFNSRTEEAVGKDDS